MSEQEDTIASTTNTEASMSEEDSSLLIMVMVDLLKELYATSISLNLHWVRAVHSKLELNRRKYPVELCKVRLWKYWSCLVECVKTNIHMCIGVSVFSVLARNVVGTAHEDDEPFSGAFPL